MTPSPNQAGTNADTFQSYDLKASTQKTISSKDHNDSTEDNTVLTIFSKLLFWSENDKLDSTLRKLDTKMPSVSSILASISLFILGITARGEWAIFGVYAWKYFMTGGSDTYMEESHEFVESFQEWISLRFKGYFHVLIPSAIISYAMYFGLGGYLHWYYYVRQRNNPETWKCQPNKWLSPELERHEIMVGSFSLILGSAISAAFSTYILNDGEYLKVYKNFTEYGYLWLFIQGPIIFIYQDYWTYWLHRIYHLPWFYKNFHKLHHTYKQPTAFSVTAIHPVEFIHMQLTYLSIAFLIPIHWFPLSVVLMYTYYHGIIDHSGIDFKRHWWQPWQPDCIFHDNHHQYFHVNFGFNIEFWDKIHGTYRRKDRIYREDIFYGAGKSMEDATKDELDEDVKERQSENPLAHRDQDILHTKLNKSTKYPSK